MRKHTAVALGTALLSLAGAQLLQAQAVDPAVEPGTDQGVEPPAAAVPAGPAAVAPPTRGTSMAQVERRFGAPAERYAAVGQPPITRWVYPGFVVYFEYDHVVHAVVTRR